jgi:acetyl-CoA carboxylase carboxyl transferase subunit beta
MPWFRRKKKPEASAEKRITIPEGTFLKCEGCGEMVYRKEVERLLRVCPKCNFHSLLSAHERLALLCDEGAYEEFDPGIAPTDPLGFQDTKPYKERLDDYQKRTGALDAAVNAKGYIEGIETVFCVMEYAFMGGSMGSVVGEKVTRAAERALGESFPLVVVSTSGGARMQEGALSLVQMAKISSALARLHEARLPYISVLTHPTTGGVTASFAMLGDLNIAEPKALIGFAGPRVIEQTIKKELPPGFQRSEFLLEHGMLDMVVERKDLKATLARCLRAFLKRSGAEAATPVDV